MRAVIQRVSEASVTIDGKIKADIKSGLLVFVGIEEADEEKDAIWLAAKICNMRIFSDAMGLMNLSIKDTNGEILLVSQFTLHALTKKGNRPSFIKAARPEKAIPLYTFFISALEKNLEKKINTGEFGADMKVKLINDGPVTIIVDTSWQE